MKRIDIIINNEIVLLKKYLSPQIRIAIKKYFTFKNPKYEEALKRGGSTRYIDKYLFLFKENKDFLYLPRGHTNSVLSFLNNNGFICTVTDDRRKLKLTNFIFNGKLKSYQQKAVSSILDKDFGVLQAPCGAGKTIIALYIIAKRKQPTMIIVHTKELLEQWIKAIEYFLSVKRNNIGIIGARKEKINPITVGMAQTLAKCNLAEISKYFGQIIIDECHHTPATTFFNVIRKFDSKYMLGLSATPYRKDKLTKLIYFAIGNQSYKIEERELISSHKIIEPRIIVRLTDFYYPYGESEDGSNPSEYQTMIKKLIRDGDRNSLIVNDIKKEVLNGNYIMVLTDRKRHCSIIARRLTKENILCKIIISDISKKKRDYIKLLLENDSLKVIIGTGQLLGEGFDQPKINRLFLITPIKWKGKVKQCLGRIMRIAKEKTDAKVYDYVDCKIEVLLNSYNTRRREVYNYYSQFLSRKGEL